MLGRSAELGELERSVVGSLSGPQIIEISGDPWIGKTHLLGGFMELARHHGWEVASGCEPFLPGSLRFGLIRDALSDVLRKAASPLSDTFPSEHARWLAGLFPGLATVAPAAEPVSPADVYHTFHAIRGLLEQLSEDLPGKGLLLAMDDVHWADTATVDLLCYLIRHPPSPRFALALGFRHRQVDRALQDLLVRVEAEGRVHRCHLAGLSEADALTLPGLTLRDGRRRSLVREADGNPGRILALASIACSEGRRTGTCPELPTDVLAWCSRDLRPLSPRTRLVAQAAALLGETFEPELLAEVAQQSEAETWSGLDELAHADIVRVAPSSSQFRFRDPLLRAALYQSAGAGWRFGAHSRAAAGLARRQRPLPMQAVHLEHSATPADTDAARVLWDAARATLWERPGIAGSWACTALQLQGDAQAEPWQQLLAGQALVMDGRLCEGLELCQRAATGFPGTELWTDAVDWAVRALRLLGRHDEARARLRTAAEMLPADAGRARTVLAVASLCVDVETGLSGPEQGHEESCPADPGWHVRHLAVLATVDVMVGRTPRAAARVRAADQILAAMSPRTLARHLEVLYWLGICQLRLGDGDGATRQLRRGLRLAEHHGLHYLVPHLVTALGEVLLRRGDLAGASDHAEYGREAAQSIGSEFLVTQAQGLRRRVERVARGGPDNVPLAAVATLDLVAVAGDVGESLVGSWGENIRAGLSLLSAREREIAMLVSDGLTNQQIARSLGLSPKTVETYLARTFKKLDVCSRAQVAALVGQSDSASPTDPGVAARHGSGKIPTPRSATGTAG